MLIKLTNSTDCSMYHVYDPPVNQQVNQLYANQIKSQTQYLKENQKKIDWCDEDVFLDDW
jgi:hypothetical protein